MGLKMGGNSRIFSASFVGDARFSLICKGDAFFSVHNWVLAKNVEAEKVGFGAERNSKLQIFFA